jgi:hypothetical protein
MTTKPADPRQGRRGEEIERQQPNLNVKIEKKEKISHGKHNPTAQHQPHQPWQRPAPKDPHPFLPQHPARTHKRVAVLGPRLDALHTRLDRVQRLRHVHSDEAGHTTDREGGQGAQPLAGRDVRLGELLERGIGAEAGGRVGRLARGGGHEALEEAADAALAGDDRGAVEKAAHARVGGLAVVDSGEAVSPGALGEGRIHYGVWGKGIGWGRSGVGGKKGEKGVSKHTIVS